MRSQTLYWFMMQIGMVLRFLTSYPVGALRRRWDESTTGAPKRSQLPFTDRPCVAWLSGISANILSVRDILREHLFGRRRKSLHEDSFRRRRRGRAGPEYSGLGASGDPVQANAGCSPAPEGRAEGPFTASGSRD